MILHIVIGMEYLHDQSVAHCGLKFFKILVDPFVDEKLHAKGYAIVKLSNMELDKVKMYGLTGSNATRSNIETRTWLTPEIIGKHLPDQQNIHQFF
jgi:hypothetical protein